MALLKLGRHESANADATVALSIDPTYAKAYMRRATARRAMRDFEGAARDFEKVLELEPRSKQARDELEKTRSMQAKAREAPPPTTQVKGNVAGSFDENIRAAFSKRIKEEPAVSKPGQVLTVNVFD